MTQVTVGENEGIESALKRFKRQVSKSGIFADLKRLRHHETPIEKYKRKLQQRRKARRRCCLLYTSPSPRDLSTSRMPSSA